MLFLEIRDGDKVEIKYEGRTVAVTSFSMTRKGECKLNIESLPQVGFELEKLDLKRSLKKKLGVRYLKHEKL